MSKQSPCYKCQDREFGCHSVCDKYKEFDAKNKALTKLKREIYTKNNAINEVEFRFKNKRAKRKNRQ